MAQKSTQWTYCQLYTCLYASFVFVFMLVLKWMASWRMYPKACWYDAAWSAQKSSLAEFFIRLIAGSVWGLVDLHDRTNVM